MEAQSVTISLNDTSRRFEISPERVPMAVLREFAKDAEDLLRGDGKSVDTNALEVKIVKGSLQFVTQPVSSADLFSDLQSLLTSQLLDNLQAKRREVVAKWQKLTRSSRQIQIKISGAWSQREIVISSDSDYRSDDADQWVRVERYLRGEIFDMGGKQTANAHMLLPDGTRLTVQTSKDAIRADKTNRLYKPAMVRIRAEYNVQTREYRDAKLIEFVEHDFKFDPDAFERMTTRGTAAWKDVPNAADWVNSLRGGGV